MSTNDRILKIWEARLASKTLKIITDDVPYSYEYEIKDDQSKIVLLVSKKEDPLLGLVENPSPTIVLKYGEFVIKISKNEKAEDLYKITKAMLEEQLNLIIEAELTARGL